MTASPLEARCSVTPLEALRRLIAVAKTADGMGFESKADWDVFERELGVAEMVVRDSAPVAAQPVEVVDEVQGEYLKAMADMQIFGTGVMVGNKHVALEDVFLMTKNPTSAAPQPAAQPSDDVALTDKQCAKIKAKAAKATDDWLESQPEDNPQLKSDGIFIRHIAAAIKAAMAQEKA